MTEPPLRTVFRRAEHEGVDDRRLRGNLRNGAVVRIARGSYALSEEWNALQPIGRHAQRVWEAAARMSPGRVFSHHSAAAILGMRMLGSWPERIEITGSGLGGSSGSISRHDRDPSACAVLPWRDHFVTAPAQTAVDLAALLPFARGVAVADQALWARRAGGALTSRPELDDAAERYRGRAHARVMRVAGFARPGADSVRESESRVVIAALGFPEPVLQHRFVLRSGRIAFSDFWWEQHGHVGEFDGIGKYIEPVLLAGRTPAQALIDEKDRADELRREVRTISRWRSPALASPRLLYDILTGDGLPSVRPRPGR